MMNIENLMVVVVVVVVVVEGRVQLIFAPFHRQSILHAVLVPQPHVTRAAVAHDRMDPAQGTPPTFAYALPKAVGPTAAWKVRSIIFVC